MKYSLETVKMMIEWWSGEGQCNVQEDRKESKHRGYEFFVFPSDIPKDRNKYK